MQYIKVALLLSLSMFTKWSFAQTGPAIQFHYDAAGKRIKRDYNPSAMLNRQGDTLSEESPGEKFEDLKRLTAIVVKAYPNPTDNFIIIENFSWLATDKAFVRISDASGKQLLDVALMQRKSQISLSNFVPGMYHAYYYLNGKLLTNWKIVKQ